MNWEEVDAAACQTNDDEQVLLLEDLNLDSTSYVYATTENYPAFAEAAVLDELSISELPQPQQAATNPPQVAANLPDVEQNPQSNTKAIANVGPKKLVVGNFVTSLAGKPALPKSNEANDQNQLQSVRSVEADIIYNPLRPQPVVQATDDAPMEIRQAPTRIQNMESAAPAPQLEPDRQFAVANNAKDATNDTVDGISETTPLVRSEEFQSPASTDADSNANTPAAIRDEELAPSDQGENVSDAPAGRNIPAKQISNRLATRPRPVESGEFDNPIRESIAPDPYRSQAENDKVENQINQPVVIATKSFEDQLNEVWWSDKMREPLRNGTVAIPLDLDSLLVRTLMHSAQIQVFSELPLIRETAVTEASANFDWHAFTESLWNETSDPVGSTLTVGGNGTRFRDHKLTAITGVRRRNPVGGQVEFDQEFGHENSNSNFFIPNNQGTARLRMSYTHPLMRGSGRVYNQSLIVLAEVDTSVARDELVRQVSGHLLEVTRAYWGLALERATYLQKVRLYESSRDILQNLEARRELDTYRSQIFRAQSAVALRQSDLIRAEVAIRNAEARIRALVNDPHLGNDQTTELIPMDEPFSQDLGVDLQETLTVAMQKRPEVAQAFKQIRAAGVRRDMTKNELLPTLNLLLTSYVSGLQGNSNVGDAWADQFSVGQPSYSVGFNLEVPLGNRASRARDMRRLLELRQFESQLRLTMETVNLEVGVAVRETDASFQEMQAKYLAMQAAEEDSQYVRKRWELLPGDNANASLVFDELLRTQQRLTETEQAFVAAQTTYNLSLTNLKKSAGILLETENVATGRTVINGVPTIIFDKSDIPFVGELDAPLPASPADFQASPNSGN